jgi:hypothetical protein
MRSESTASGGRRSFVSLELVLGLVTRDAPTSFALARVSKILGATKAKARKPALRNFHDGVRRLISMLTTMWASPGFST